MGGGWVGQAITDPISGPSFDFTFTIGPELDKRTGMLSISTELQFSEKHIYYQIIQLQSRRIRRRGNRNYQSTIKLSECFTSFVSMPFSLKF